MAVVLILGSHVASSRVGGTLTNLTLALSPFEIEPIHVPTTLFGRHPGLGAPGGGAVEAALFAGMLAGIGDSGLFAGVDAVLTNYFASAGQVTIAAQAIDAVKAANPKAIVLIDPVMGDAPAGLYVNEAVAHAIASDLLPRADYLTPNLWELGALTGLPTTTLAQIRYAAASLGKPTLVTSYRAQRQIGCLLVDGDSATPSLSPEVSGAPKGTGDLLAALLLGHLLQGQVPVAAMAKAVAGVSAVIEASQQWKTSDLPIISAAKAAWQVGA
jgi:pyridoxine kinase